MAVFVVGNEFVQVACQVCGASHGDVVYTRSFETAVLGRAAMSLVLCRGCGFLYASPRPSAETMEHHYRHSSRASGAVWHAHGEGSRHEHFSAFRSGFVGRVLPRPGRNGSVLDVGCSQGDQVSAYDLPGWRRFGLEPSTTASAKARGRGIEVVERTLGENTFADGSFDLVTCWSVLEHVSDVRLAMAELARLVKQGGFVVLCVPNSLRPVAMVSEFFSFEHLSHFTNGTLFRLAQSVGLRPVLCEHSAGSGLTVGLRHDGVEATRSLSFPDDREALVSALERYKGERAVFEADVQQRFQVHMRDWRARDARVALFGAGEHSQFLLDLIDFEDRVVAILDSDPAKQGRGFLRWDVAAPHEAAALGIDAIVVSSCPFQEEMVAAIQPMATAHGIDVVRCYPICEAERVA